IARKRQRATGDVELGPDLARPAGQMGARKSFGYAPAGSAAQCAAAETESHCRSADDAATDGRTSGKSSLLELSQNDGPNRVRFGEFRRYWKMAHNGSWAETRRFGSTRRW